MAGSKREIISYLRKKKDEKVRALQHEKMEKPKELADFQKNVLAEIKKAITPFGLKFRHDSDDEFAGSELLCYINDKKGRSLSFNTYHHDATIFAEAEKKYAAEKQKKIMLIESEFSKVEEALIMNGLDDETRAMVEAFKGVLAS